MIPGGASATGNINVTAVLAIMTFAVVLDAGMQAVGGGRLLDRDSSPSSTCRRCMKPPLWLLMFVIEIAGLFIRHVVLAVRLFANMLAGHIVLAVILGFILAVGGGSSTSWPRRASRASCPEPAGAVRGVPASVHFHVSVRAVHRLGGPPALSDVEASRPGGRATARRRPWAARRRIPQAAQSGPHPPPSCWHP